MADEVKDGLPVGEEGGAVGNGVAEESAEPVESQPDLAAVDQAGAQADSAGAEFKPVVNEGDAAEGDAEAAMLAMLEEEGKKVGAEAGSTGGDDFPDLSGVAMESPVAHPAQFQPLNPSRGVVDTRNNIDMLMDVRMPVSIELGRTELPISELLSLGPGSVVELNKLAGEPVDLLVNNRIIAKGEVVVVDENFGVRITQLLSPEERIKSLAEG